MHPSFVALDMSPQLFDSGRHVVGLEQVEDALVEAINRLLLAALNMPIDFDDESVPLAVHQEFREACAIARYSLKQAGRE